MYERHARYQRVIADVVGSLDSEVGGVHLVAGSQQITADTADLFLPDGLHRSEAGHAALAGLLADLVAPT
jgi:lysophospholipase L1-like esterase